MLFALKEALYTVGTIITFHVCLVVVLFWTGLTCYTWHTDYLLYLEAKADGRHNTEHWSPRTDTEKYIKMYWCTCCTCILWCTIAVVNTDMHLLKPALLTLGCALELLRQCGSPSCNIWQSLPHTGMSQPASPTRWYKEETVKSVKTLDVILSKDKCFIPCVFLDGNFFWDRQRKNDDEAHDEESKSLVSVPVIRHLSLTGPSHRLV